MKKIIFMLTACSLFFTNCKTSHNLSGTYTHEIECMGSELDGSVTLKTWGKGRNRADGVEQAKKEALYAVLFVGIRNGKPDCDVRPILNAPNIRESKADYFNIFFKDGGDYMKYVSNQDKSFGKIERARGRDGEFLFGFVTRVMRSELKQQMIKDGILN